MFPPFIRQQMFCLFFNSLSFPNVLKTLNSFDLLNSSKNLDKEVRQVKISDFWSEFEIKYPMKLNPILSEPSE